MLTNVDFHIAKALKCDANDLSVEYHGINCSTMVHVKTDAMYDCFYDGNRGVYLILDARTGDVIYKK